MFNYQTCCRLCLKVSKPYMNCTEISDLCQKIEIIFGFKITENDDCSQKICKECLYRVTSIMTYRDSVLGNQKTIENYQQLQLKLAKLKEEASSDDDVICITEEQPVANNDVTSSTENDSGKPLPTVSSTKIDDNDNPRNPRHTFSKRISGRFSSLSNSSKEVDINSQINKTPLKFKKAKIVLRHVSESDVAGLTVRKRDCEILKLDIKPGIRLMLKKKKDIKTEENKTKLSPQTQKESNINCKVNQKEKTSKDDKLLKISEEDDVPLISIRNKLVENTDTKVVETDDLKKDTKVDKQAMYVSHTSVGKIRSRHIKVAELSTLHPYKIVNPPKTLQSNCITPAPPIVSKTLQSNCTTPAPPIVSKTLQTNCTTPAPPIVSKTLQSNCTTPAPPIVSKTLQSNCTTPAPPIVSKTLPVTTIPFTSLTPVPSSSQNSMPSTARTNTLQIVMNGYKTNLMNSNFSLPSNSIRTASGTSSSSTLTHPTTSNISTMVTKVSPKVTNTLKEQLQKFSQLPPTIVVSSSQAAMSSANVSSLISTVTRNQSTTSVMPTTVSKSFTNVQKTTSITPLIMSTTFSTPKTVPIPVSVSTLVNRQSLPNRDNSSSTFTQIHQQPLVARTYHRNYLPKTASLTTNPLTVQSQDNRNIQIVVPQSKSLLQPPPSQLQSISKIGINNDFNNRRVKVLSVNELNLRASCSNSDNQQQQQETTTRGIQDPNSLELLSSKKLPLRITLSKSQNKIHIKLTDQRLEELHYNTLTIQERLAVRKSLLEPVSWSRISKAIKECSLDTYSSKLLECIECIPTLSD